MIHDCIAVGLADQNLSEKLQLDADHSLEKAIHSVQQNKSVRSQQAIVRGQEDAVKQQKWTEFTSPNPRKSPRTSLTLQGKTYKPLVCQNNLTKDVCKRCGKSLAHKSQCPAKDANSRQCKKKGHFQHIRLCGKVNTAADDTFLVLLVQTKLIVYT